MSKKRPAFIFPAPDPEFIPEEVYFSIPEPEDFMYLQKLNDRDGDDKFLGWLHKGSVLESIKKGSILTARNQKNEIIGFLLGNIRRDGYGRVNSICVCKEFRRFGVGKLLMREFLSMNKNGLLLKVLTQNHKGLEFFSNKLQGTKIKEEVNKKGNTLFEFLITSIPD